MPDADLHVSGVLTPDATGGFYELGVFAGKPYYRRLDNAWTIWWFDFAGQWLISPDIGITVGPVWSKVGDPVAGLYNPAGGAVGIATVS